MSDKNKKAEEMSPEEVALAKAEKEKARKKKDISEWTPVLSAKGLHADDATVGILARSRVMSSSHPEFGFDAWWNFFEQHHLTPRVPDIVRLADAGLQAGNHPYWGMQTWYKVLDSYDVAPTLNAVLRAQQVHLWATSKRRLGPAYGDWAKIAGDGTRGFELIVAANDQNVRLEDFQEWLTGPDARVVSEAAGVSTSSTQAPSSGLNVVSVDELVSVLGRLPKNPRLFVSGNFAAPKALLAVADEALPEFIIHALNAQKGLPEREGIVYETCFVGAGMRKSPTLRYIPSRLSLVGNLLATKLPPDACLINVSAPRGGRVSLGVETNIVPSAIEATRARGGIIVAQVNQHMPYTFGDAEIDCTLIDYALLADEPLHVAHSNAGDPVSMAIGANIAPLIPNGATLQLGIGGIPDAVLRSLTTQNNLSVWTEMFSDGVVELFEQERLNRDDTIRASFAFGTQRLYDWLDGNRDVRMLRTETINDPGRIAARTAMVSINAALQVDLYAQANASRVKKKIFSGFGGSTDFIVGALHSPGGQAFIALSSWHKKSNTSTIVPTLSTPATSFQHSAVVTEQGVAHVAGRTSQEQAELIINRAADPRARKDLYAAARELNILP